MAAYGLWGGTLLGGTAPVAAAAAPDDEVSDGVVGLASSFCNNKKNKYVAKKQTFQSCTTRRILFVTKQFRTNCTSFLMKFSVILQFEIYTDVIAILDDHKNSMISIFYHHIS